MLHNRLHVQLVLHPCGGGGKATRLASRQPHPTGIPDSRFSWTKKFKTAERISFYHRQQVLQHIKDIVQMLVNNSFYKENVLSVSKRCSNILDRLWVSKQVSQIDL